MQYSILLPYYDPKYEKTEKFTRLIKSLVTHATNQDYEFVFVKDGNSYVESHNTALQNAKGDYFLIFNDDIEIQDPQFMEKLSVGENAIGLWRGTCHAWGMGRDVYEKVGLFDELFKDGFNCEDTDYLHRAELAGVKLVRVEAELVHHQNHIQYGSIEHNKELFIKKWGYNP
jgi:hypothetical protein